MIKTKWHIIFLIVIGSLFSLLFSISHGSLTISFTDLLFGHQSLLLHLRLSRTVTAFTSGGLLALAGALMQLLMQNPLADPALLGITSGAALGSLLVMWLGMSSEWLVSGAWAGSLCSMLFIFLLAKKHAWQSHTLLLTGIAFAFALAAAVNVLLLFSPENQIHSMLFWLAGDLNTAQLPWFSLALLIMGVIIGWFCAPGFNLLLRGEMEATCLGLPIKPYRIGLYLLSALFTAAAVTLGGSIGFIGLLVPHFTRELIGFDHHYVLPISVLLGGSIVTLADTCARSWFTPQQLPVGIFISLIGAPLFIWLLQKS